MVAETSELQVIQDLIDAGAIDAGDVIEANPNRDRDNQVTADANGTLKGGDGDDTYIGQEGVAETFFFDGRDDNNDEGRHVDVVQNFTLNEDTWRFRLDGKFFAGLEQTTNGNQASFESARDFADLMLSLNQRTGTDRGGDFTFKNQDRQHETIDKIDNSGVKVVEVRDDRGRVIREHLVFTFDDTDFKEDHIDRRGNFKTNDLTIVFEDFAETLAATFANELGFASENASNADSVLIASTSGGNINGGTGDNLFILSDASDNIQIDDRHAGNDEGEHVNIIHGFDLEMDSFSGRFDGSFFDGSNRARFEGAAGVLELLTFAETVDDSSGDLIFTLQSVNTNRNPLTYVLTDISLNDVFSAAQSQVFEAIVDAGIVESAEVVEISRGDDVITEPQNGRFQSGKGDDLLIGTPNADVFSFDSRDGAADGASDVDRSQHVKAIVGFNSDDSLTFRIDGGFFAGDNLPGINNNQATVASDDIDELGALLNGKEGENEAFYDLETNSTVLIIDDSPSNDTPFRTNDELTIVLFNAGNLL